MAAKKKAAASKGRAPAKNKEEAKDNPIGRKGPRGPKGVAMDAKIKLLVDENPKREGSAAHGRFANYKDGMTVADALAAGLRTSDLKYDTAHEFIKIA